MLKYSLEMDNVCMLSDLGSSLPAYLTLSRTMGSG